MPEIKVTPLGECQELTDCYASSTDNKSASNFNISRSIKNCPPTYIYTLNAFRVDFCGGQKQFLFFVFSTVSMQPLLAGEANS